MTIEISLPERVVLAGIGYIVQEHEGLITFSEHGGFYGLHTRMAFQRERKGCWYFEFSSSFGKIMASHIEQAYKFVQKYRGKNHD